MQGRPVSDLANVAKSVCNTRVVLDGSLVGRISLEVAMFRWIAVAGPMGLAVPAALKFLTPLRWGGWVFRVSRTVG